MHTHCSWYGRLPWGNCLSHVLFPNNSTTAWWRGTTASSTGRRFCRCRRTGARRPCSTRGTSGTGAGWTTQTRGPTRAGRGGAVYNARRAGGKPRLAAEPERVRLLPREPGEPRGPQRDEDQDSWSVGGQREQRMVAELLEFSPGAGLAAISHQRPMDPRSDRNVGCRTGSDDLQRGLRLDRCHRDHRPDRRDTVGVVWRGDRRRPALPGG